jgi:hypothetical protein
VCVCVCVCVCVYVCVLAVSGFEPRALCLMDKCSTTSATSPELFAFTYLFYRESCSFLLYADLSLSSSSLYLPCSWNSSSIPPHSGCLLRWDLSNFLQQLTLNHCLPHLCLLSTWHCRQETLCPVHVYVYHWNRVMLWIPSWPQAHNSFASTSWVLELQECTMYIEVGLLQLVYKFMEILFKADL